MKLINAAVGLLLLMTAQISVADMTGDAKRGKPLYAVCAGCHGDKGAGNADFKAPRLSGQFEWYLVSQLQNFKSGKRGSAEGDLNGAVMMGMASILADDQAMHDVVAYIMTLKAKRYKYRK